MASPVATFSVAHHEVDQNPARVRCGLFRFHDAGRLDGVSGPDRLDPSDFEPAVNGAGRIGPVGNQRGDHPEIVHAGMMMPPQEPTSERWKAQYRRGPPYDR